MASKKFFMGVDGGGSKLLSILFDEDMSLVSKGLGGSINSNFASPEEVAKSMEDSIKGCLPPDFKGPVTCCYTAGPGPFDRYVRILSKYVDVAEHKGLGEGTVCLLAGTMKKDGMVALSGTGSGAFYIRDGITLAHLGGWGALIGDEGSGFDIGRKGLMAATYSYDARGPKTHLEEMIRDHFGVGDFLSIRTEVYKKPVFRTAIAQLCLVVLKAAKAGDETAVRILQGAGEDMAWQILALAKREKVDLKSIDIVVSGSVWKYNPMMFDAFCQAIRATEPEANVYMPIFEPAVGAILYEAYRLHGVLTEEVKDKILREFNAFKFQKD